MVSWQRLKQAAPLAAGNTIGAKGHKRRGEGGEEGKSGDGNAKLINLHADLAIRSNRSVS